MAADAAALMAYLDVHDLAGSQRALTVLLADVARRYGQASATLAVDQYKRARADAGIRGTYRPVPGDPAPLEQVARSIQWALQPLYGPNPDVAAFETKLTGIAEKLALDPGRDTIVDNSRRDPKSAGWARLPEAGTCSFCALLATRGAVYKEDTVGFKSHDHCRCHAEPVFGKYQPSEQIQQWQELYGTVRHGSSSQLLQRFRTAFDANASH